MDLSTRIRIIKVNEVKNAYLVMFIAVEESLVFEEFVRAENPFAFVAREAGLVEGSFQGE